MKSVTNRFRNDVELACAIFIYKNMDNEYWGHTRDDFYTLGTFLERELIHGKRPQQTSVFVVVRKNIIYSPEYIDKRNTYGLNLI